MPELISPTSVFKCLADETRARMTLLIAAEGELCVCELSAALEEFAGEHFDYVITLCDKAAFECSALPGAGEYIAWNFEDPAIRRQANAYKQTLHEIHERIKMFVLVKSKR